MAFHLAVCPRISFGAWVRGPPTADGRTSAPISRIMGHFLESKQHQHVLYRDRRSLSFIFPRGGIGSARRSLLDDTLTIARSLLGVGSADRVLPYSSGCGRAMDPVHMARTMGFSCQALTGRSWGARIFGHLNIGHSTWHRRESIHRLGVDFELGCTSVCILSIHTSEDTAGTRPPDAARVAG
jgi:hypothetical protein